MGEILSSEEVAEVRQAVDVDRGSAVASAIVALCDTVESLRAENETLLHFLDVSSETINARNAELVAKRRHAPGCLHDEPGVTICICQPVESVELETLRGIAKRNRDRWVPHRDQTGAYWERYALRSTSGHLIAEEPMTEVEVNTIYKQKKENNSE